MSILYLSHGAEDTGGYRLETDLCRALGSFREIRFRRNYRGLFQWMQLFFQAFFHARNEVVLTVARLAWPVYLRNLFSRNKIIVVLHNFDENDGKPALYFQLLKWYLKRIKKNSSKLSVVVVSEFMRKKLEENFGLKYDGKQANLFLFPNLFENEKYRFYADVAKKNRKLIHLGQYSEKIDKKAYHLFIDALHKKGYQCYFSSPYDPGRINFPLTVFQSTEAYLKQMAISAFTVIMNKVEEGWSRVAHESLLVGTPLLVAGGGGPEEIIRQFGGGKICRNSEEIFKTILDEEHFITHLSELEKFHINHISRYSAPIKTWLQQ